MVVEESVRSYRRSCAFRNRVGTSVRSSFLSRAVLLSGCLSLGLIGCVWVGAGVGVASAGIEAYRRGEFRLTQDASIERIWLATLITLDEFELPVTEEKLSTNRGTLVSRDNDGKKIQITLKTQSPRLTLLRIRVGVFGDHALAAAIAERVRFHNKNTGSGGVVSH